MSSRPSQMELSIWAIPRCHRCIVDHIPQFTSIHIKSFQVTSIHLGFIWFYIYIYIFIYCLCKSATPSLTRIENENDDRAVKNCFPGASLWFGGRTLLMIFSTFFVRSVTTLCLGRPTGNHGRPMSTTLHGEASASR